MEKEKNEKTQTKEKTKQKEMISMLGLYLIIIQSSPIPLLL